jgi:hypothetical protein
MVEPASLLEIRETTAVLVVWQAIVSTLVRPKISLAGRSTMTLKLVITVPLGSFRSSTVPPSLPTK